MDGLDFSVLTDDQLIGLIRAALRECVARGGAVQAAARDATLDEAERAQVARAAADREAAKLRAQERERVAREAAEEVRRQHEAREAAARRAEAEQAAARRAEEARIAAEETVRKADARDAMRRSWLTRFAVATGMKPGEITLVRASTRHGWRVLLNQGDDRYADRHLVDYYPEAAVIHTAQALVGRKRELLLLCAEFWAANPKVEATYLGSSYQWEDTTSVA